MVNISEGFDSSSDKSFINFLNYSNRSASEVQSLLYVVLDQEYISKNEFEFMYEKCKDIKNLIGGLIQYLSKAMTKDNGLRITNYKRWTTDKN
jgi:four helix bundle protein